MHTYSYVYDLTVSSDSFQIIENHLGKALIATRFIPAGEKILKMSGPILKTREEVLLCEAEDHLIQVDTGVYYDPLSPGRYINHSCDPNSILSGQILLSIKNILAGEEINFDYSTTMDEDNYTLECMCGSPHCRRVVLDFKFLPKEIQDKYLDLGGVQSFIGLKYSSRM